MKIATLAGVPVRLHWTFLAVLGVWFAMALPGAVQGAHGGWWAQLQAIGPTLTLAVVLFFSVVLHELGHALVARAFGVRTLQIVLFPLGGMAVMERARLRPLGDLLIAFGGPAVNLILAAVLAGPAYLTHDPTLFMAAGMNLALGVLNLIPAYPMDGGRVLRAVLTEAFGLARAQQVSVALGTAFAVGALVAAAFTRSPGLAVLGGFLLLVLGREARQRALAAAHAS